MSGALSLLNQGAAIAGGVMQSGRALAGLLSGSVPFGAAGGVTLGGFQFQGFEVPESINFGTEQNIVTHRYPGGGFAKDVMGPMPRDPQWSGQMIGAGAAQRAQQLDQMCAAGEVIDLTWGEFSYPVIIRSFDADYRSRHWIGQYRILCEVAPPPEAEEDEDSDVLGDLADDAEGGGILGALGDAAGEVGGVLSDVANAAGEVLGVAQGAVAAVSGVITPITNALGIQVPFLSQLQCGLNLAGGAIGTLGSVGAGLSGFGAEFGTGAATGYAGDLNAYGMDDAGYELDYAADTAPDGEPFSAGQTDTVTAAARDSAVGARAGGAINTAQQNARRTSGTGAGLPTPPRPPSGEGEAGVTVGPVIRVSPAASSPDVSVPGTATAAPPPVRSSAETRFGTGAAPGAQADRAGTSRETSDAGKFLALRSLSNEMRANGAPETQIKAAFDKGTRPDLYVPTSAPNGISFKYQNQFGGPR